MKTVLLRAPALTQSGYGVHSSQIARLLIEREKLVGDIAVHFQVLPWGNTPWMIDSSMRDGLVGEIMSRAVDPKQKYDLTIQVQLPNEWDPSLGIKNIGVTAGVESDKCNPEWITACNAMSHIVVPSQHVLKTLSCYNNLTTPVTIIPESFSDACLLNTDQLPKPIDLPSKFNFLVFGQITGNNPHNDRKNTFFTLKWLFETFKDNKDVGIVLKTNAGRNTLIDRNIVLKLLKQVISETRSGEYPRVHLIHGDMSDEEVVSLYKHPQIKALVSLTHGEGYGLPILEAATCGLPVIATSWSGHMDFMSLGKFINVYYSLESIHESRIDGKIFVKGSRWAMPSEQDFKKRIAKFHQSPTIPTQWASELSETIKQRLSYTKISALYNELLFESKEQDNK